MNEREANPNPYVTAASHHWALFATSKSLMEAGADDRAHRYVGFIRALRQKGDYTVCTRSLGGVPTV